MAATDVNGRQAGDGVTFERPIKVGTVPPAVPAEQSEPMQCGSSSEAVPVPTDTVKTPIKVTKRTR